jgi:hypothetical protein
MLSGSVLKGGIRGQASEESARESSAHVGKSWAGSELLTRAFGEKSRAQNRREAAPRHKMKSYEPTVICDESYPVAPETGITRLASPSAPGY